jgi:long-subunit fatty acid transport protein
MKRLLISLAVLPFAAGVAVAAQPLTNLQMDGITAGFSTIDIADAEAFVNKGTAALTSAATLDEVTVFATTTGGEVTVTAYKTIGGSQSSSVTSSIPTVSLPGPNPGR